MPLAASSKRERLDVFHEDSPDDERVVVQAASSSLRNEAPRKRARLSSNNTARESRRSIDSEEGKDGEEDDDDDDESMAEPEDRDPTPPTATQYELIRDQGFKHLEYAEQDDQRATQRLKERPLVIGENHAALNAIIESITCVNFMCHVKLHVELGPLLNFIVGENGSGKSAVLTAITLCLGGKASATNRGGSLRSFVKEGTEHASLTVRIKNQGEDAYRPDLYGESIICERWFTKSGSSGFKVKSAANRIISTKKADVDDIVEWYCLQVDNPLNVLSQDNARQFLNSAPPAQKYTYFIRGTQLEQLDDDYKVVTDYLETQRSKLAQLEENLASIRKKYEKAVKLRDSVSKAAEMRSKSRTLMRQLAWAQVQEEEEILRQKEQDVAAAEENITRVQQVIAEKAGVLQSLDERVELAKAGLATEVEEETRVAEAEAEAKERFEEARNKLAQLHSQERQLHVSLGAADKAVKKAEENVAKEEKRLEEANGGAVTALRRQQDALREALEKIEEAIKSHEPGLKPLEKARDEAIEKAKGPSKAVVEKRQEIQTAESSLRSLQQDRQDPLDAYDPNMRQLLNMIDGDKGFAQKPIGPLGTYVQLTKRQWMPILNTHLHSTLSGFIVGNKADEARLTSHAQRLRMSVPTIFISGASLGRLNEPDARFDTILRVLKIDDQRVRDCLIINHFIEQTLLIEDREEAEQVMFDGPPENSGSCFAFHEKRRNIGQRVTNNRGSLCTRPFELKFNQARLKTGQDDQIHVYENLIVQLKADCREAEALQRIAEQDVQRAKQEVAQHMDRTSQLQNQSRKTKIEMDKIDEDIQAYEGADDKLQGLRDNLKEDQDRKDVHGKQYAEVALQKSEANAAAEERRNEAEQAKAALRDQKVLVGKAKDKVGRLEELRRLALLEKNKAHDDLDEAKITKTRAEASREKQAAYVEDFTRQATEISEDRVPIPEGQTYRSLERQFEDIQAERQKLRQKMGASEEQISSRAAEASQEYREARAAVKTVKATVDLLNKSLGDRLGKFREFQRHVSAQARCNFSYLLSERGYRGQLLLDHQTRKLTLEVEPDKTREKEGGRNTKTLSGGEKSFSSICLLLAIWDAMGSPLRCLDEFDVFMDNVNRAISTNMLVTAARRSVGKQFILITPNAIEGRAKLDKDVKIIRLTDPRQQRLPEMIE
ncbi:P-loop containing nucleoside triphosphate hydrolase protein [Xylariaceae sp. FL0594]|nr:P-loop containing nucleoside triphosphate hydrolase protein [Xylariaceae sp. FL0594]